MFKYILGIISLAVAACAAFFSVQGLATLYSGQFLAVCIMASSLEVGKLVAASYLHRFWDNTSKLLKTYLVCAVLVLMGITSLGIYGFLSSAYQVNSSKVELVDSKQDSVNSKKIFIEKEITSLNQRVATLNLARTEQEKRLQGSTSKTSKLIYDDINRSGNEITQLRDRINQLSSQLLDSEDQIIDLKTKKNEIGDIGTLKFVADSFGVSLEQVVKYFTLAIVLVFDPLAVCLLLAYNTLISKPQNKLPEQISEELDLNLIKVEETNKLLPSIISNKLNISN